MRLPLSTDVAVKLNDWFIACNMPPAHRSILIDKNGHRLDRGQFSYLIQSIAREAGLTRFPVTPHVLRHSLNLVRRQGGIDATLRSALLGHSSPGSLISYEHVEPQELIVARAQQTRALGDYLKNARNYADRALQQGTSSE